MKARIDNIELEGTPEECAEFFKLFQGNAGDKLAFTHVLGEAPELPTVSMDINGEVVHGVKPADVLATAVKVAEKQETAKTTCARCGKPIPPGPGYSRIRTDGKREHKRCDLYADKPRSERVERPDNQGDALGDASTPRPKPDSPRNSEGKIPLGYYARPPGRKDVKQCDQCNRWFKEKYLTGREGGGRVCLRCESMPKAPLPPGRQPAKCFRCGQPFGDEECVGVGRFRSHKRCDPASRPSLEPRTFKKKITLKPGQVPPNDPAEEEYLTEDERDLARKLRKGV